MPANLQLARTAMVLMGILQLILWMGGALTAIVWDPSRLLPLVVLGAVPLWASFCIYTSQPTAPRELPAFPPIDNEGDAA